MPRVAQAKQLVLPLLLIGGAIAAANLGIWDVPKLNTLTKPLPDTKTTIALLTITAIAITYQKTNSTPGTGMKYILETTAIAAIGYLTGTILGPRLITTIPL